MTAGTAIVSLLADRTARTLRLSLRDGIEVIAQGNDLSFDSAFGAVRFRRVPAGVAEVLASLATSASTLDELSDRVLAMDGVHQLHRLYFHINDLALRGLLRHTLADGGTPLATLEGFSRYYRFEPYEIARDRAYVLSRFALLRREGVRFLIESPLGHARVVLHAARGAALVASLAEPRMPRELCADEELAAGFLLLLRNAGAVTTPDEEEENAAVVQWSVHDLFFHARSRFGRHENPFGATFRHARTIAPLPAVKPLPRGETIDLPEPDLARLEATDPSLAVAMERRRTVYVYAARPITAAELGEFLFRVARVRAMFDVPVPGHAGMAMPVSSRPYPSGGKSYELELYLTIAECDGIASGLYHYDPLGHRLTKIRERNGAVDALLQYVRIAAPDIEQVQVLITVAARFQRVAWKYDSIAYATTLRHVGVLYQTMYLAAAAMGLAPCALGSGDADLFAAASGLDYLVEGSVGDFLLGSAAPTTRGNR